MSTLTTSNLKEATIETITALISVASEGQELEFKEALSGSQEEDTWKTQRKIQAPAIAALTKELVAFANSRGGVLILGMREREGVATELVELDDVSVLADRLSQSCRDNIEPSLIGLEVKAVGRENSRAGVLVIGVPPSPYAPHRSRFDRHCYERRGASSVPMKMEDIHRQVLDESRRWQKIDDWFSRQTPGSARTGWVMRAVARPLTAMNVPNLHRRKELRPQAPRTTIVVEGQSVQCQFFADDHNWRPIVRGTRSVDTDALTGQRITMEAFEDGGLVFEWRRTIFEEKKPVIYPNWIIGMVACLLLAIERLRVGSGQSVDYGLEFHFVFTEDTRRDSYAKNYATYESNGIYEEGSTTLGRYLIGSRESFQEVLENFERDTHNLAGLDRNQKISFHLAPHLDQIDKINKA